jgi:hypothetical protein
MSEVEREGEGGEGGKRDRPDEDLSESTIRLSVLDLLRVCELFPIEEEARVFVEGQQGMGAKAGKEGGEVGRWGRKFKQASPLAQPYSFNVATRATTVPGCSCSRPC